MPKYKLIAKHKNPANNMEIYFADTDEAIVYRDKCIKQGYEPVTLESEE